MQVFNGIVNGNSCDLYGLEWSHDWLLYLRSAELFAFFGMVRFILCLGFMNSIFDVLDDVPSQLLWAVW